MAREEKGRAASEPSPFAWDSPRRLLTGACVHVVVTLATGETSERNESTKRRDGTARTAEVLFQTGLSEVDEREGRARRHFDEGASKREGDGVFESRRTARTDKESDGELSKLEKSQRRGA